jgi:peptidoglycan/LPS O-acetylase OafA/YrhL
VKVLGWLDAKPLRLLGLCSGSYYVLHSFFVPAAAVVAAFVIAESWCTNVPAFAMWAAVFVFLAMMFPIALASYFLVEAPGIALGRYLNRALQPRRLLRATETAAEARSARAGGPV